MWVSPIFPLSPLRRALFLIFVITFLRWFHTAGSEIHERNPGCHKTRTGPSCSMPFSSFIFLSSLSPILEPNVRRQREAGSEFSRLLPTSPDFSQLFPTSPEFSRLLPTFPDLYCFRTRDFDMGESAIQANSSGRVWTRLAGVWSGLVIVWEKSGTSLKPD
jgi:hypothetical protein